MPPRKAASTATSEAPGAKYLDKEPSAIHIADADFINAYVGKQVVTARQVMFNKLLLAKAQAARAAEKDGDRSTKAATTKAAARATTGRKPATKAKPASKARTTTTRGRRGSQAAASKEAATTTAPAADENSPF